MTENVKSRGCMDSRWHGAGIEWITDAKSWLEDTMSNTSLRLFIHKVTKGLLVNGGSSGKLWRIHTR